VFSFDLPMSISGQCTFPASKMLEMYIGNCALIEGPEQPEHSASAPRLTRWFLGAGVMGREVRSQPRAQTQSPSLVAISRALRATRTNPLIGHPTLKHWQADWHQGRV
jgi:hypothetical protein